MTGLHHLLLPTPGRSVASAGPRDLPVLLQRQALRRATASHQRGLHPPWYGPYVKSTHKTRLIPGTAWISEPLC